jgi:hypothetical protein
MGQQGDAMTKTETRRVRRAAYLPCVLVALALAALLPTTTTAAAHGAEEICTVNDPTATPLNVRKTPGGTILGALHNGRNVMAVKRSGKWTKIHPLEGGGKSGWVLHDYLQCGEELKACPPNTYLRNGVCWQSVAIRPQSAEEIWEQRCEESMMDGLNSRLGKSYGGFNYDEVRKICNRQAEESNKSAEIVAREKARIAERDSCPGPNGYMREDGSCWQRVTVPEYKPAPGAPICHSGPVVVPCAPDYDPNYGRTVEMPKELRGVWCDTPRKPYYIRGHNCGEPIQIAREGVFWEENACKPYSISVDSTWIKVKSKCNKEVDAIEWSYKVKNGRLYTR